MSDDMKFDPNAATPSWTNNEGELIETNTDVRVKLFGIRTDVGQIIAVGSIKEDYLGYFYNHILFIRICCLPYPRCLNTV